MDENAKVDSTDEAATLDPPGTIAVIGDGPLGIEAALYGRYLGYDVTRIAAQSAVDDWFGEGADDAPIPMRPDRCASPLARLALDAQAADSGPKRSPTTMGEWRNQIWQPLSETDLLRGRVRAEPSLTSIDLVPVDQEEEGEEQDDESVPPDFQLTFSEGDPLVCEAIVVASLSEVPCSFPLPTDYFFRLQIEVTGARGTFLEWTEANRGRVRGVGWSGRVGSLSTGPRLKSGVGSLAGAAGLFGGGVADASVTAPPCPAPSLDLILTCCLDSARRIGGADAEFAENPDCSETRCDGCEIVDRLVAFVAADVARHRPCRGG